MVWEGFVVKVTREWLEEKRGVVEDLLKDIEGETDSGVQVQLIGRLRLEVVEVQRELAAALRPSSRKKFALAVEEVLRQARPAARKKVMGLLDGEVGRSGGNRRQCAVGSRQKAGGGRTAPQPPTLGE